MSDYKGNVLLLAGGVGGSKLAEGLARALDPAQLTIIGNVGDDVEMHGLWISPDVDIITYTLAGVVDREKGWGFADESFDVLHSLKRLGEDTWMLLGDRDLATHILRTNLRSQGARPTSIAGIIAKQLGVEQTILPPTDDPLQTHVRTRDGWLNFQEYFLRERCRPEVLEVRYEGSDDAAITPEVNAAIESADLIVIAPSNPIASIGPILSVRGMRGALRSSTAPKIAVCPLVGGKSLKGPTDRMMRSLGFEADALGVARCYDGLIDALVIDEADSSEKPALDSTGIEAFTTDTVMREPDDRHRLAVSVLEFSNSLTVHVAK